MGRNHRPQVAGVLYHVTARGNVRQDIYLDEEDRNVFLTLLAEACTKDGLVCHAYCLMSNHYHLLLETPRSNLGVAMHRINCVYSNRFNRVHEREGHVLERPYRAWIMHGGRREMEAARYIARNPVRAGLCPKVDDWPWSSYPAISGLVARPSFLSIDRLRAWFGTDEEEAIARYRHFVDSGKDEPAEATGP